jgi:hypothetical protein
MPFANVPEIGDAASLIESVKAVYKSTEESIEEISRDNNRKLVRTSNALRGNPNDEQSKAERDAAEKVRLTNEAQHTAARVAVMCAAHVMAANELIGELS